MDEFVIRLHSVMLVCLHSKTHPLCSTVMGHAHIAVYVYTSIGACFLHFFYNPYNYVPFIYLSTSFKLSTPY